MLILENVQDILFDYGDKLKKIALEQPKKYTLLHLAVLEGRPKDIPAILETDPSLLEKVGGDRLLTPLMLAALQKNTAAVRVLLELKAAVITTCKEGNTALHYAVFKHRDFFLSLNASVRDIVLLLLKAGAVVNTPNKRNQTPLDAVLHMSEVGTIKQSIIVDLMIHGADTDRQDLHSDFSRKFLPFKTGLGKLDNENLKLVEMLKVVRKHVSQEYLQFLAERIGQHWLHAGTAVYDGDSELLAKSLTDIFRKIGKEMSDRIDGALVYLPDFKASEADRLVIKQGYEQYLCKYYFDITPEEIIWGLHIRALSYSPKVITDGSRGDTKAAQDNPTNTVSASLPEPLLALVNQYVGVGYEERWYSDQQSYINELDRQIGWLLNNTLNVVSKVVGSNVTQAVPAPSSAVETKIAADVCCADVKRSKEDHKKTGTSTAVQCWVPAEDSPLLLLLKNMQQKALTVTVQEDEHTKYTKLDDKPRV